LRQHGRRHLLGRDVSTDDAESRDPGGNGDYPGVDEALFFDRYNNKDKGRSFWGGLNARF
jgi:outer membrane receptor for ferrienterochelin and colicins